MYYGHREYLKLSEALIRHSQALVHQQSDELAIQVSGCMLCICAHLQNAGIAVKLLHAGA